jgi:uncharacterized OB-fold protein
MEGTYSKPLPEIDDINRPFWDATRRGELRLQRCQDCSHVWYPAGTNCPKCLSTSFEWRPMSGRGTVWSFIVYHHCWHRGFEKEIPYNVAMIQLEEGPIVITNIVDVKNETIKVGMPVKVVFEHATDEVTLFKFKPA